MAERKKSKGFAGLEDLVSEVEPTASAPEPTQHASETPVASEPEPVASRVYTGNPAASGNSSGKWWVIGIAAFIVVAWLANSDKPKNPSYASPAPAPPPAANPPSASAYQPAQEIMPPRGQGVLLDRPQIRYCLSEKIRIEAWRGQFNKHSDTAVDAFNAAVGNYNARCSQFRYQRGDLDGVQAEVEANSMKLVQQGLALAKRNP